MIIIAGPCKLESKEHALNIANTMKKICDDNGFDYVFKSSFDKANRTRIKGKSGLGIEKSKEIFKKLREQGFSKITKIHEPQQWKKMTQFVVL